MTHRARYGYCAGNGLGIRSKYTARGSQIGTCGFVELNVDIVQLSGFGVCFLDEPLTFLLNSFIPGYDQRETGHARSFGTKREAFGAGHGAFGITSWG